MILNPQKIEEKRRQLGPSWMVYNGAYALTQVDVAKDSPAFFPASGIPVIVFVNQMTGELKLFPAIIFQ